jgi:hypothetical protein
MQRITPLKLIRDFAIALNLCLLVPAACHGADAVLTQSSPSKIGGWYPVFFDQEDQALLQKIIDQSKSGLVSKLIVDFDQNTALAKNIIDTLKANCQCVVESRLSKNQDTDSVKFNHQRVTVLVYSAR